MSAGMTIRGESGKAPLAGLLDLDRAAVARNFPHRPFLIRHHLAAHPLFALPRLMELARRLPEKDVEYNAGNLPVSVDPALTPRTGLSIEDTIRRIEECGSWMVLKFVEQDAEYRDLLNQCVDEVLACCDPPMEGVRGRAAFLFISSPAAVTPYHMDPEHNFLLQIRGTKTMNVFDAADRSLLSQRDLERFFGGGHRNLVFQDHYQSKASPFTLRPGIGLHVPVTAPHWVKNGEQVSISFSITFRSEASERREAIYRINHRLRTWRVSPADYGRHPGRDSAKLLAYRAALGLKRTLWRRLGRAA